MTDTPFPSNLSKLIEQAKGTPYEDLVKDEEALRKAFLNTLKTNDDPRLREIGNGIADGTMTWLQVASSSAYAEVIDEKVAGLREFDGSDLMEELESEQSKTAATRQRERELDDADDADNNFRGLGEEPR
jgi:hypothetical protein